MLGSKARKRLKIGFKLERLEDQFFLYHGFTIEGLEAQINSGLVRALQHDLGSKEFEIERGNIEETKQRPRRNERSRN